jgi:hypothetical protein
MNDHDDINDYNWLIIKCKRRLFRLGDYVPNAFIEFRFEP